MFLKTTNNKNIEIKRAKGLKRILVIPLTFFLFFFCSSEGLFYLNVLSKMKEG